MQQNHRFLSPWFHLLHILLNTVNVSFKITCKVDLPYLWPLICPFPIDLILSAFQLMPLVQTMRFLFHRLWPCTPHFRSMACFCFRRIWNSLYKKMCSSKDRGFAASKSLLFVIFYFFFFLEVMRLFWKSLCSAFFSRVGNPVSPPELEPCAASAVLHVRLNFSVSTLFSVTFIIYTIQFY